MANYFIAGPAEVSLFDGNQLVGTAKTLIDSSISLSSSKEEVRGGLGNSLYGNYYHTSAMTINLTDVMFKLEYIAYQTGSTILTGNNIYTDEQVTSDANGQVTLTGTPVAIGGSNILWYSIPGTDVWTQGTFTGSAFTVPGVSVATTYCVKYLIASNASKYIKVSSSFIPSTIKLIMNAKLFSGGSTVSTSTVAGVVQIDVPRFQFNGSQDISMTATGISNTPIAGSALSNESTDCSGGGYYAIITRTINNANWYDDVYALAVVGGDISVAATTPYALNVKAIPTSGAAFTPNYADLTFTATGSGITVTNAGVVTGATASQSGSVNIKITNKAAVETDVGVSVTA